MKSKGKVFLLDDDGLIVSVLSRALKKEGYEVHEETETDGVVNKIEMWNPDILLLDISMPGRDGIDILRRKPGGLDSAGVDIPHADAFVLAHLDEPASGRDGHRRTSHAVLDGRCGLGEKPLAGLDVKATEQMVGAAEDLPAVV